MAYIPFWILELLHELLFTLGVPAVPPPPFH
jgi:hypothetical protein